MSSNIVTHPEPIKPTNNKGASSALSNFRKVGNAVISGLPHVNRSRKDRNLSMPPIGAVNKAKNALFNAIERTQQRVSGRQPNKLNVNMSARKAPFSKSPVSNAPTSKVNPNLYANSPNLPPTEAAYSKYATMSGPLYSEVGTSSVPRTRKATDPLPKIPNTGTYEIPEGNYMKINTVRLKNPHGVYQSVANVNNGTKPATTTTQKRQVLALGSVNNTTPIVPRNKYNRQYFNKTLKQFRKNSSLNLANTKKLNLFRKIATNARIRNMPLNQKVNFIRKLTGKQRFKFGKYGFGKRKLSNNNSRLAQHAAVESTLKNNPIFNSGESSSDPIMVISDNEGYESES
jgi:hypothetical protein